MTLASCWIGSPPPPKSKRTARPPPRLQMQVSVERRKEGDTGRQPTQMLARHTGSPWFPPWGEVPKQGTHPRSEPSPVERSFCLWSGHCTRYTVIFNSTQIARMAEPGSWPQGRIHRRGHLPRHLGQSGLIVPIICELLLSWLLIFSFNEAHN